MNDLAYPPPSLSPPLLNVDDPIRTTQLLLDRVYSLIPWALRLSHVSPSTPPPIINGCFRNHVDSKLLTMEQEGFPIYYGQTPVTTHAVAANSVSFRLVHLSHAPYINFNPLCLALPIVIYNLNCAPAAVSMAFSPP